MTFTRTEPLEKYMLTLVREDGHKIVIDLRRIKKTIIILRAVYKLRRTGVLARIDDFGSITIADLLERIKVTREFIAVNLNILRRAKLLEARKDGRYVYFSANIESIAELDKLAIALCQKSSLVVSTGRHIRFELRPVKKAELILNILGDALRWKLLVMIAEEDKSRVLDLCEKTGMSKHALLYHLGLFRKAGIITPHLVGTNLYRAYTINDKRLAEIEKFIKVACPVEKII